MGSSPKKSTKNWEKKVQIVPQKSTKKVRLRDLTHSNFMVLKLQDFLYILTDLCNVFSASADSWYDHDILGVVKNLGKFNVHLPFIGMKQKGY